MRFNRIGLCLLAAVFTVLLPAESWARTSVSRAA